MPNKQQIDELKVILLERKENIYQILITVEQILIN